jgi:hypothetical protein
LEFLHYLPGAFDVDRWTIAGKQRRGRGKKQHRDEYAFHGLPFQKDQAGDAIGSAPRSEQPAASIDARIATFLVMVRRVRIGRGTIPHNDSTAELQ